MIELNELLAISDFLDRGRDSTSARSLADWCEAREVDLQALVRYSHALVRSTLENIAREEDEDGEEAHAAKVEDHLAAAVLTAMQVGVDVERRRRDVLELPA